MTTIETKEEKLEQLATLQARLHDVEAQRSKLVKARSVVMASLHKEHGASLREIGDVCNMSATAVSGNLARLEAAEAAEADG